MPKFRSATASSGRFDYGRFDKKVVVYLRSVAKRFLRPSRKTLADVIDDGNKLWDVKRLLDYGEFDKWRGAEFGARERTAENAMAVAKWLGAKSAIIAELPIGITACYRLVGRSVPEAAPQEALRRARALEKITVAVADAIIAKWRNPADAKPLTAEQPARCIRRLVEKSRQRLSPVEFSRLGRLVQDYFDSQGLRIAT